MNSQPNPWIGQTLIGRYRVLSPLKEGGMASLYLAQNVRSQQTVVIKTPRPELMDDSEFLGRFAREAKALASLSHPNIVPILDSGEHQGQPFFVLQYMTRGTLRNRQPLDAAGRPVPVALESLVLWLLPIASALDYLHTQNLIHRDVKPDNILFDDDDVPYLCDFGILKLAADGAASSKFATQYTKSGFIIGTPQYMAPELIQGERGDGRADQFSLGITLYELLAGQPPVPDTAPATILVKLLRKNYPPLEQIVRGLPPGLTDAVARATASDRNQRFPSCRDFAKAVMVAARLDSAGRAPILDALPVEEVLPVAARKPQAVAQRPTPAKQPSGPVPVMARATCPSCGAVNELPRSDSPRTVACARCGLEFEVMFRTKPATTPPPPVSQAQIETPPAQATPPAATPARPSKRTAVKSNPAKATGENMPVAELNAPRFSFPWRFLVKSMAFLIFLSCLGVGGWFGYQRLMVYMADSRIKQSANHAGRGNYAEALVAADNAVKYRPITSSYLQRGRIRLMMLDWFGAFDDFNLICEELEPGFAPAYAYRAEARMRLSLKNEKPPQRKEALNDVDKALKLDKNLGYAYAVKGWILAQDKDASPERSRDLEEAFRKAKEFAPTDPEVLLLRGDAHASLNSTSEFEQDLREALHYAAKKPNAEGSNSGDQPSDENRYIAARGLIYCWTNSNLSGADADLAKLTPNDYFFRPLLEAEIAVHKFNYKHAAEQYEIFLRNSPQASTIYYAVADCYMKQGGNLNLDTAETRAAEGLKYCPRSAALYAKRGEIRMALKHYEDAVADYDMAIKLNSDYPQAKSLRDEAMKKAQENRIPK